MQGLSLSLMSPTFKRDCWAHVRTRIYSRPRDNPPQNVNHEQMTPYWNLARDDMRWIRDVAAYITRSLAGSWTHTFPYNRCHPRRFVLSVRLSPKRNLDQIQMTRVSPIPRLINVTP